LLAIPQERLIAKPLMAFVPLPERHAFRTHLTHLAAGTQPQVWDGMLQPREGAPFFAALTVAPMRDCQGSLVGLRWLIRDINERRRTQEALRAERDFITALLDTVGALVVVWDLHGRIVRFNRAAEQLTGYAFEDIQGKPLWNLLLAPEDVEPFQATFQTLIADQPQLPHTST
jgi:PAS domain-containing protein